MTVEMFAGLEPVFGPAIRTHGLSGVPHVQVDLGVGIPEFHIGLGVGTEDTALRSQVLGQQFHGVLAHGVHTRASHCAYFGLRPFTISKNAL